MASRLRRALENVVTHEIDHCPRSGGNDADHAEEGVMADDAMTDDDDDAEFAPKTVRRFIEAKSWHDTK